MSFLLWSVILIIAVVVWINYPRPQKKISGQTVLITGKNRPIILFAFSIERKGIFPSALLNPSDIMLLFNLLILCILIQRAFINRLGGGSGIGRLMGLYFSKEGCPVFPFAKQFINVRSFFGILI